MLLHIIEAPHPMATKLSLLAMKQALINCRQHEAFIKVLMVGLPWSCKFLKIIVARYNFLCGNIGCARRKF